jgi:hypothetical protein
MAYFPGAVRKFVAFLVCFLATLVLGFADLRWLSPDSCIAVDSCCCGDSALTTPCVCADHSDLDSPEMVTFVGLPHLGAPPARELQTGETTPLADLLPRWHPALPWQVPPEKNRARFSVWIL